MEENETIRYYVHMPEEILNQGEMQDEPEGKYGYIHTPDGQQRLATKEEYDAIHAEDASD